MDENNKTDTSQETDCPPELELTLFTTAIMSDEREQLPSVNAQTIGGQYDEIELKLNAKSLQFSRW